VRGLQQLDPADFFQIQTNRVLDRIVVAVLQVFLLKALQRAGFDSFPVRSALFPAGLAGRE